MIQGSLKWHRARLGIFSSSNIHLLLEGSKTPGQSFSRSGMTYIYQKAAERTIDPRFKDTDEGLTLYLDRVNRQSKSMRWGNDIEDMARKKYEEVTDNKVKTVGFVKLNSYLGDSPDGIISRSKEGKGTIEIKCPDPSTYLRYCQITTADELRKECKDYYMQCQGHILINRAKWCDFIAYDPMQQNPIHILRIYPDADVQKQIRIRTDEANRLIKQIINGNNI